MGGYGIRKGQGEGDIVVFQLSPALRAMMEDERTNDVCLKKAASTEIAGITTGDDGTVVHPHLALHDHEHRHQHAVKTGGLGQTKIKIRVDDHDDSGADKCFAEVSDKLSATVETLCQHFYR